jgi:aspartate aminotransferase
MALSLSRRAASIQPSVTFALSTRAKELKAQGRPVLDLTLGEPDLDTPAPVVEAAHRALEQRHFHYTPTAGVSALREAVARVYAPRLGVDVEPSWCMATQGAKQALFNALATAADPGDEIVLLAPYWVSYVEQCHALGLKPVIVPCPASSGYRPDLEALERALRTARGVLLNFPCNPTGAALDRAEMEALCAIIASGGAWIVSDEIYEDIVYRPEGHVSPLHVAPELSARTCVVTGLSKGFAMTGWRIGFSIAPPAWTAAMARLQGHATSHIASVCQQAALAALERRDLIAPLREVFTARRERVLERAAALPGVRVHPPEGTFYLFLEVGEVLGGAADSDTELARRLLEEQYLGLVPGSAFGAPGHLRLSFAAADAVLDEALDRLQTALSTV